MPLMVQIGHKLQFHCLACESVITFSVLDAESMHEVITCPGCRKRYLFDDETLLRHLRKFEALCRQIYASEEILGSTSIAIDVGGSHVKVPFNILLTRLSSVLELNVGGKKSTISFRIEPLKEVAEVESLV